MSQAFCFGSARKGTVGIMRKTCSECAREIPDNTWSCPHCGNPGEPVESDPISQGLSTKGRAGLIILFIGFPTLLLLMRIYIYAM